MTGVQVGERGVWWEHDERGWLWADGGGIALQPASSRALAEQYVSLFEDQGMFWCAGHERWEAKPWAFRHFAGVYCEEAAEKHKAKNSRACLICRRPLWECSC